LPDGPAPENHPPRKFVQNLDLPRRIWIGITRRPPRVREFGGWTGFRRAKAGPYRGMTGPERAFKWRFFSLCVGAGGNVLDPARNTKIRGTPQFGAVRVANKWPLGSRPGVAPEDFGRRKAGPHSPCRPSVGSSRTERRVGEETNAGRAAFLRPAKGRKRAACRGAFRRKNHLKGHDRSFDQLALQSYPRTRVMTKWERRWFLGPPDSTGALSSPRLHWRADVRTRNIRRDSRGRGGEEKGKK